MKHISVLGATGFIGSHLTATLRQRGFDVVTLQGPANDAVWATADVRNAAHRTIARPGRITTSISDSCSDAQHLTEAEGKALPTKGPR